VLAVLLSQGIDTLVQVRKALHTDGLAKQIELAIVRFREFAKNDSGGTVRRRRIEEVLEGLSHGPENIIGKLRGSGEIDFKTRVPKLLRPEENHHPLGGEFVLACFDAGILNVLGKLGKDKRPITRRWRKRLYFLNRVVGLMLP